MEKSSIASEESTKPTKTEPTSSQLKMGRKLVIELTNLKKIF